MTPSRILITGAGGFIGSYLTRHFLNLGAEVIAHSRNVNILRREFELIFSPSMLKQLDYLEGDLTDPDFMTQSVEADTVIHLAAATDTLSQDFWKGIELSVRGTHHTLELALRNRISKFIFFSSFQVYGRELTGTISEKTPIQPINYYGLNHWLAEEAVAMAHRLGHTQCVVLRPSNIYGSPLLSTIKRWYLVPLCFCQEAHQHQRITLHSSGLQTRNFVGLNTVAQACEAILGYYPNQYEVINVVSPSVFTIRDIAEKVASIYYKRYQQPIDIIYTSQKPLSSNLFTVDSSRLESLGVKEEETGISLDSIIHNIFDLLDSPVPTPLLR